MVPHDPGGERAPSPTEVGGKANWLFVILSNQDWWEYSFLAKIQLEKKFVTAWESQYMQRKTSHMQYMQP